MSMAGNWTPAVAFDDIPGTLPHPSLLKYVDLAELEAIAIEKLNHLKQSDLTANCIWRDLLAHTGTYRTFHGDRVLSTLQQLQDERQATPFRLLGNPSRPDKHGWIDVDVAFDVLGHCNS